MTQPAAVPPCLVCAKRPQPEGSQACHPCRAGMAADLDAIPTLAALLEAALLEAAVADRAQAPRWAGDLGHRASVASLPGGEALNLVAGSNDGVRLRYVPLMGTEIVPVVKLVELPGQDEPVVDVRWLRQPVLDEVTGRPVLVPDGDQHGDLGPWVMVARWVQGWAALRGVGEVGADDEIGWLRQRLDWACAEHPDIGGWADELHRVADGMRQILAVKRHVVRYAERCPDERCGAAGSLYRIVDPLLDEDDPRVRYINCGACGRLFELGDERIDEPGRRAA